MLDPWIIEEIRRREDEQRRHDEQKPAVIELPFHEPPQGGQSKPAKPADDTPPRGVHIIDFTIG
jgi:hypothetical protein